MRSEKFFSKKTCLVIGSVFATLMLLIMSGCGGGHGSGNSATSLTPAAKAAINRAESAINTALESNGGINSAAALEAARQAAVADPAVEQALASDGNLIVKFRNAGIEMWIHEIARAIPPDLPALQEQTRQVISKLRAARSAGRAAVGNKKAVVINCVADDTDSESMRRDGIAVEKSSALLQAAGFQVDQLYGSKATVEALKNLQQYSVIVWCGHSGKINLGDIKGEAIWNGFHPYAQQTGEQHSDDDTPDFIDWVQNRVVKMHVGWGAGDDQTRDKHLRTFFAVTGKFWKDYYSGHHFNRMLFLNGGCSSFEDDNAFRNDLRAVGMVSYTGWTEDQSMGPFTNWRLLTRMAAGRTLSQAFDDLPEFYKKDKNEKTGIEAELKIDGEGDLTLGVSTISHQILVSTPQPDQTYTDRVIDYAGAITGWDPLWNAAIETNGVLSSLSPISSGDFGGRTVLRSGANKIIVRVIRPDGEDREEVDVIGNFAPQSFWSELSWNTDGNDVDLHMVPVSGADGSTEECYFAHRSADWGGSLDVDDVDGFGPEHITATSLPAGRYKVFVHYYATHGVTTPATAYVSIATGANEIRYFQSPQPLTQVGDIWNVCYVNYPSGTVEPINQFVAGDGTRSSRHYPAKPRR